MRTHEKIIKEQIEIATMLRVFGGGFLMTWLAIPVGVALDMFGYNLVAGRVSAGMIVVGFLIALFVILHAVLTHPSIRR